MNIRFQNYIFCCVVCWFLWSIFHFHYVLQWIWMQTFQNIKQKLTLGTNTLCFTMILDAFLLKSCSGGPRRLWRSGSALGGSGGAHCTVCSLYSVLTAQCAHCTVCSLYSVLTVQCAHCTVCSLHSVLTVQCAHCTVCSLYSVLTVKCAHCTVCSLYSVLTVCKVQSM